MPGVRTVAMTSNGLALARRLPALQRAGLSALNLSLDSLRPERFEVMARRPVSAASPPSTPHRLVPRPQPILAERSLLMQGLPKVLASMDLALQLGFDSVKVNTVLMKGKRDAG